MDIDRWIVKERENWLKRKKIGLIDLMPRHRTATLQKKHTNMLTFSQHGSSSIFTVSRHVQSLRHILDNSTIAHFLFDIHLPMNATAYPHTKPVFTLPFVVSPALRAVENANCIIQTN